MKKCIFFYFAIFALFVSTANCDDFIPNQYIVKIEDKKDSFRIKLTTSQIQNCICSLVISSLHLTKPFFEEEGKLELEVQQDPRGYCLMAFGRHNGSFLFNKREETPNNLALGVYQLFINGRCYGLLHVEKENTYLTSSKLLGQKG